MTLANYGIKEEIREYWTKRAENFDQSPGHGMHSDRERKAWARLIGNHLGPIERPDVLELAFGTGEVTRVLLDLDCKVIGLDLTEAMLQRARAKHRGRAGLQLRLGDAEDTREPDQTYDVVICRHLVWTLIDPLAAFRDWYRILKPGGRVIILDGNYVEMSWGERMRQAVSKWLAGFQTAQEPAIDWQAHESIMRHVYFREGVTVKRVTPLLQQAGFADFRSSGLDEVHRAQRATATLAQKLRVGIGEKFVLSCVKPPLRHE